MGFGSDQIDTWEPWQLAAAQRGWMKANSPPKARAPSDEEFRAAIARTVH